MNILHKTSIDISQHNREHLISILNESLATTSDLKMQLKNAHWNVKGMEFIALHKMFDDMAEELEEQTDIIAERITSLGGSANGTIQQTVNGTLLKPYPTNIFSAKEHLTELSKSFSVTAKIARENIKKTEGLLDMATSDVFIDLTRILDKNLWFIEAHLQK